MRNGAAYIERRIRADRRRELDEYIAGRVDFRTGRDRRTADKIKADNAFVADRLRRWYEIVPVQR